MKTFRELYCEQRKISDDRYERDLVMRCLHRHARPVYWLLGLDREYTSPDLEFIRCVGELRNRRQFRDEAAEFFYHPGNGKFFRKVLRLRVSSRRLQAIFDGLVAGGNSSTSHP
ncbi:MAG: hypothetical protein WDM96_08195 [Lacunisphaera sp.]